MPDRCRSRPRLNSQLDAATRNTIKKGEDGDGIRARQLRKPASLTLNQKVDRGLELPAKMVQRRLGHSSIVMTMDTYGHLFASKDDGAARAEAERTLLGIGPDPALNGRNPRLRTGAVSSFGIRPHRPTARSPQPLTFRVWSGTADSGMY